MTSHRVALRDFDSLHDADRLAEWLDRPHVKRWWFMQKAEDLIAHEPGSHAIIEADGTAVGYLCWEFPPLQDLEAAGLTDLPRDLIDIDILVGDPELLGQGIGSTALQLLLDRLRTRSDVRYAGLATSIDNQIARRAYEKAGFKVFREFDDPESGRCYYLVQETGS